MFRYYYKVSYLSINNENKIQGAGVKLFESRRRKNIDDFEKYFNMNYSGNGNCYVLNVDIISTIIYDELGPGEEI